MHTFLYKAANIDNYEMNYETLPATFSIATKIL